MRSERRSRLATPGAAVLVAVVAAASTAALAVLGAAHPAAAQALKYATNWNAELCGGTFYALPNGTTNDPFTSGPITYGSQYAQAKTALANTQWMILREGVWTKNIHFSSTCHVNWTPSWFDGSEEKFNSWYEAQPTVAAWCDDSTAVGCCGPDYEFPGSSVILAADTTVARSLTADASWSWGVINQDSVQDYVENEAFSSCASFENVWLHEVGHAYGLPHLNAQISTMGSGSFCVKNINIPQAYSDQFWPIDNAAMRARYEVASGASTRRNFSASAFRRFLGQDSINSPSAVFLTASTPSAIVGLRYSLNRYFSASTGSVRVQFRFVPDGLEPTFNWSTLTWSWPANTSTDLSDVHNAPAGTADTATTFPMSFVVHRNDLPGPTGTWYRMWMHVDFDGAWSETDEGDNMVPTRVYVVKS